MHRIVCLALCAMSLAFPTLARAASDAIAADNNPISPGQTVTLRWYFTGDKVVVSGGRFGKGTVVTGRTSLTDKPRKTTRYTFDAWYHAPVKSPRSGKMENTPLHTQYSITIEVTGGPTPGLSSYRDPHGWQVSYLSGWKRDNVTTPDEGSDGLVFFQQEPDSVERLVVAVMPVKETSCVDLMDKIRADMPSHYEQVEILSQDSITHRNVPALWTTFRGIDQAHPGTRTQSIILALVRGGRAYVISARTQAQRFASRRALLEKMVKSFTITKNAANFDRTASTASTH